ncbi:MAG TPA: CHAT domain-containing protein [Paludibaculum sp.]|jgi:CHAT domain-containing protein
MSPGLEKLVLAGHRHLQQQKYDLARMAFLEASDYAEREGNHKYIPRLRSNIGATFLAVQQYQNALPYFLEARSMARAQGDEETDASANVNLAAVYIAIGEGDAAAESLAAAAAIMPAGNPNRARLLAQRARLEYRRGGGTAATELMWGALAEAQSAGDLGVEGLIWDDLAMLRMDEGDLDGAEAALANEYRLWVLFHTPNPEYLDLRVAQLRLLQGRANESLSWLNRAEIHSRRSPGSMMPHEREHDVALALEAAGRRGEALQAARRAWRWSAEWRQEALPAQSAQIAADVTQAELAALYARLAGGAEEHQEDVFLAVERSRAASLRYAILNRPVVRERLGLEYRRALMEWRSRTARWLNGGREGEEPKEIGVLRARLAEIEIGAGLPAAVAERAGPSLIRQMGSRLGSGAVLFSFQLGEPESSAWLLSAQGVKQARLPGRADLRKQIERFRESIEANDGAAPELGARLYGALFGFAPRAALEAGRWYLSLDDELLALPFAALQPAAGQWLVESHCLSVVPSALWLLWETPPRPSGRLLAVGDAVHNSADPRLRQSTGRARLATPLSFWMWRPEPEPASTSQLELPALAGSGQELEKVAAVWRGGGQPAEVLSGVRASLEKLTEAMNRRPGTLHFATHVIPVPRGKRGFLLRQSLSRDGDRSLKVDSRPDDAFLALSLRAGGVRDGINTASVPAYEVPGSLVVLNGCNSGLARMQPGAGLMGFARAWMSAGAAAVVASLWSLTDDSGAMFESFYTARLSGRPASASLQAAQRAMIHGQGWRAEPRHWAAYVSAGQE